jgi:cell division protein FtsW
MMSDTDDRKKTPTVRERREATVGRIGFRERYRMPTERPPAVVYWIGITVASLVLLGLIMVLSASSVVNLYDGSSAWGMFQRQLLWVILGSVAMYFAIIMPYDMWKGNGFLLVPVTLTVLVANLVVGARGRITNGAQAWLNIGQFQFQPSEFMKIMTVLFCANFLARRHRSVAIKQAVLYPMLSVLLITVGLCVLQRDFGGATIFFGVIITVLFMAGIPWRQLLAVVGGTAAIAVLGYPYAGSAAVRVHAWLNMDQEVVRIDKGYQVYQALLSIANGGWKGTGAGSGTSKWGYVPLAHSDFIFAVVAEEMGLLGTVLVFGGFLLLIYFAVQVAYNASDTHGAFIAGGVAAWFGVQAFVNIGGVVGLIPMTGLTLPFLSYGGSSIVASMIGAGLLINVARYPKKSV